MNRRSTPLLPSNSILRRISDRHAIVAEVADVYGNSSALAAAATEECPCELVKITQEMVRRIVITYEADARTLNAVRDRLASTLPMAQVEGSHAQAVEYAIISETEIAHVFGNVRRQISSWLQPVEKACEGASSSTDIPKALPLQVQRQFCVLYAWQIAVTTAVYCESGFCWPTETPTFSDTYNIARFFVNVGASPGPTLLNQLDGSFSAISQAVWREIFRLRRAQVDTGRSARHGTLLRKLLIEQGVPLRLVQAALPSIPTSVLAGHLSRYPLPLLGDMCNQQSA